MSSEAPDLSQLTLLVQRLLDAELLPDADGAALLEQTQAADLFLKAGDREMGLSHVAQIAEATEALVRSDLLDLADGRAVIRTARRILSKEGDKPPDDLL